MFFHRLFDSARYTNWEDTHSSNLEYSYYCDKFNNSVTNTFVFYILRIYIKILSDSLSDLCLLFTYYFGFITTICIVKVIHIDHFRISSMNYFHQLRNNESLLSNIHFILKNDFKKKNIFK